MPAQSIRILVIAEEAARQSQVRDALGAVARLAFSGSPADAMSGLANATFDVVLFCIDTSEDGGTAAIERLSAAAAPTPLIVLTTAGSERAESAALAAGARDYIAVDGLSGFMVRRVLQNAVRLACANAALAASDERLRLSARAANALIWELDLLTDSVRYVDDAPEGLGYLLTDLPTTLGEWLPLVHPDDRERFGRTWESLLAEDATTCALEYRLLRKDGSWALVNDCGMVVRDDAGNPTRIVGALTDVTEQREAGLALRRSEARLRLIADTIRTLLYVADARPLRMTYVSPAFERMWGLPRDEIYDPETGRIGTDVLKRFLGTVHVEDRPRAEEAIARRIRGEEVYCEYRIHRGDGAVRWIGDRSYPLTGPSGQVEQIVGIVEDITEQVHAAGELQRREERLTRILETIAEGIVIVDREGRVTFANQAIEATTGLARADVIGRSFFETAWQFLGQDGRPVRLEELPVCRVFANGEPVFATELTFVRPDGQQAVMSVNAAPLLGPSGEADQVIASVRDVTHERAAAERVSFQASLLDAVGDAVAATDLAGRITFWNRQTELCTGWSADEVTGRFILDVIGSPATRDGLVEILLEAAQGRRYAGEHQIMRRDGSSYPAVITGTPIVDADGNVVGLVAASTDLTEMKLLEEQLQQAQRMEAVGRLAGGVAHDFNNILTGIKGYTHFMLEELSGSDPMRGDAEEIAKAADRAAGLTRQLLAFSRKQVLQPRVLDLGAVVSRMENMLLRLIGEDIELVCTCDRRTGRVMADPGQVEQVLLNLAVNARDAMPSGGRLHIEVRNEKQAESAAAPGWVVLRVTDTGEGIPVNARPYIFEPFFTTKETGHGTGLGLSTVYGIVTQSGGSISVESAEGVGTMFEIRLPRAAGPVDDAVGISSATRPSRGETVLLVEDEESVRMLTARTLRRVGYEVLEAENGGEALLLCEHHRGTIHLLLTDVVMPRMSGREVAERLTLMRPDMSVLFMSGYTADVIARHGILEEGQLFLEKPFTPVSLAARVREVLDARLSRI